MYLVHGAAKSYFSTSQNNVFSFQWKIENFYELQPDVSICSPRFYYNKNIRPWCLELSYSKSKSSYFLELYILNLSKNDTGKEFTITVSQNHGQSFYANIEYIFNVGKVNLLPRIRLPRSLMYDFVNIVCSIKDRRESVIGSHPESITRGISEFCPNQNFVPELQNNSQCVSNPINNSGEEEWKTDRKSRIKQKKGSKIEASTSRSEQSETENTSCDSPDLETLKQLSTDLKTILIQAKNTDVLIKVEETTIKAHKTILCARSPVFCRMFEHSTLEATNNEIVVTDIRATVMNKLINYMYTGEKSRLQYEEACDLYYAADKYEILNLREACKRDLLFLLDVNNACSMLSFANCHGDDVFKVKIMDFISENFKTVVNTEAWMELTDKDTKLSAFLMRFCAQTLN